MKVLTFTMVKKRDGRVVLFNPDKIAQALVKAGQATEEFGEQASVQLAEMVMRQMQDRFTEEIPTVEQIQDLVESVLIEQNYPKTAKAYILYRQKRLEIRQAKSALGIEDDMKLSFDALKILRQYQALHQKTNGLETPRQMLERTAKAVAKAEELYEGNPAESEKKFMEMMTELRFVPSIAVLRYAGTNHHLCEGFVLPVEDSITSIFETLKNAAVLHKSKQPEFGLGFSFSKLRPKGAVTADGSRALGPVEFMLLYDQALHQINPSGSNIGFLDVNHPDILDFITAKERYHIKSFGVAVLLTKEFIDAAARDGFYELLDPHTGQAATKLKARNVLTIISTTAWRTGDPVVYYQDRLDPNNEGFQATVPTGEHPLLPYEASFTGSINLAKHVTDGEVDWQKLEKTVATAVGFLDSAIDVCHYPLPEIKGAMKQSRRMGLGVIGWADAIIQMGIAYNSIQAVKLADEVMQFISNTAKKASTELALKRGAVSGSIRNSTRITISAGGIQSVVASCSQGIEPYFAISYLKKTPTTETVEVTPLFEETAKREGFYSEELMKKISLAGTVQGISEIPEQWRKVFVTTSDCTPDEHLAVQAAFQKHADNAVSKTINFQSTATIQEVEETYKKAYALGCKSIHLYREGSSQYQLIHTRQSEGRKKKPR